MTRWELFKGHWKILREESKRSEEPWWVGGSYNRWNCFWWAIHNSGTHDLNGEYLIPVGNKIENKKDNIMKYSEPWEHHIVENFLPSNIFEQLKSVKITSDNTVCEGTRTEITGRYFFTPDKKDALTQEVIGHILSRKKEFEDSFGYNLSHSYLRVELAQDTKDAWLQPHLDSLDKRITMIVYIDKDDNKDLGTNLYKTDDARGVQLKSNWKANRCLIFKPTEEKWHGVAKQTYKGRRLVLLINYVNKDTWNSVDQVWDVDI